MKRSVSVFPFGSNPLPSIKHSKARGGGFKTPRFKLRSRNARGGSLPKVHTANTLPQRTALPQVAHGLDHLKLGGRMSESSNDKEEKEGNKQK